MKNHKLVYLFILVCSFSLFGNESKIFWISPYGDQCIKERCECTENTPCALNNHLLRKLVAGNTVYLQGGNYDSFVIDSLNGSKDLPISFVGPENGLRAQIINSNEVLRDLIEIKNSSYISISNLKITGAKRAGIRVNNSHHVVVENNYISESGVWGIFTNHSNNFTAKSNKIIGPAQQHGIYQSNSGDNVKILDNYITNFDGCAVHFNADIAMGGANGVIGDGIISNVEISRNFFSNNGIKGGSAINLDGVDGGLINNNILLNNKSAGISLFKHDGAFGTKNIIIERNLIIMSVESRAAIIFNKSEGGNFITDNAIITQHESKGIYEVSDRAWSSDLTEKPVNMLFSSENNFYSFRKNFSNFVTFSKWKKKGMDLNSSTFNLDYFLIPIGNEMEITLPNNLKEIIKTKNIAEKNKYIEIFLQ